MGKSRKKAQETQKAEPKFKVGDKVCINNPSYGLHGKEIRIREVFPPGGQDTIVKYLDESGHLVLREEDLVLVDEETQKGMALEPTLKVGDLVRIHHAFQDGHLKAGRITEIVAGTYRVRGTLWNEEQLGKIETLKKEAFELGQEVVVKTEASDVHGGMSGPVEDIDFEEGAFTYLVGGEWWDEADLAAAEQEAGGVAKAGGASYQVEWWAPAKIRPNIRNPRTFRRDKEYEELLESARQIGVFTPVIITPAGLIIAGERRWRACGELGLATMPVIVRGDLDEHAATVITITENLQRSNITPLEEAKGIAGLLAEGFTLEQAATQLGKSPSFVARRASLTRLHQGIAAAIGGENPKLDLTRWGAAQMEMLARLPAEVQAEVFGKLEGRQQHWDRPDAWAPKQLGDFLASYFHLLAHAGWPKGVAIGGIQPCAACDARSSCQPELFEETPMTEEELDGDDFDEDDYDDDGEPIPGKAAAKAIAKRKSDPDDTCLNAACWKAKGEAWIAGREAELRGQHADLVLVASNHSHGRNDVIESWQYSKAAKGTADARAALDVATGELTYVKLSESGRRDAAAQTGEKTGKSVAEKKAQWDKLRQRIVMDLLAEELKAVVPGQVPGFDPRRSLAVIAEFGLPHSLTYHCNGSWGAVAKRLDLPTPDIWRELADCVVEVLGKRLHNYSDEPPWKEAQAVAEFYAIDLDELARQAAEQKPYPKSWRAAAELMESKRLAREEKKKGGKSGKEPVKAAKKGKKAGKKGKGGQKAEPGTCIHCGCTDEHACDEGCYWVNEAETVCSNPECLAKEEAAGNIHMDEDVLEDDEA